MTSAHDFLLICPLRKIYLFGQRQSKEPPRNEEKGAGSGGQGPRGSLPPTFPTQPWKQRLKRKRRQKLKAGSALGSVPLPPPWWGLAGPVQLPTWSTSNTSPSRKHRVELSPGRRYRFQAPSTPTPTWLTTHNSTESNQDSDEPSAGSLSVSGPQPAPGPPSPGQGKDSTSTSPPQRFLISDPIKCRVG